MTDNLEALEIIADWKDTLKARIARAQIVYELVSTDNREEVIALGREVADYKRLVATLKRLGAIAR